MSGADKATWEGLPDDDDDALAEELSAVPTMPSRSVADKDALDASSWTRARKISARSLDDYATQVASRTHELRTRRAAWKPKVWHTAQPVSAKSSEYFAASKCVREVERASLAQMEDYAPNVMVRARVGDPLRWHWRAGRAWRVLSPPAGSRRWMDGWMDGWMDRANPPAPAPNLVLSYHPIPPPPTTP